MSWSREQPNRCNSCGLPMRPEDELAAADRNEGLFEQVCLECFEQKQDNDFGGCQIDGLEANARSEGKTCAGCESNGGHGPELTERTIGREILTPPAILTRHSHGRNEPTIPRLNGGNFSEQINHNSL